MALKNTFLQTALESAEEMSLPPVTEQDYLDQTNSLAEPVVEIQNVNDTIDVATQTAIGLEAILQSLEQNAQEGLDHLSGKFLNIAYKARSQDLGFESINIPAADCFEKNGKVATRLSMEAAEGRLHQVIEAIKQLLKKFIAHLKIYWKRLMAASKTLEQRVKSVRDEMSSFDDELETFNIKLGFAEMYLVEKESDVPSILGLSDAVTLAQELQEYERAVAGSSANTLLEILRLAKKLDGDKEDSKQSFIDKLSQLAKNALPTPKFITESEANQLDGISGKSRTYPAGYIFKYETASVPHLKGLTTITGINYDRVDYFLSFSPSAEGIKPLDKKDIASTLTLLEKLAKIQQGTGEAFDRTENLVDRIVAEFRFDQKASGADDIIARDVLMFLKQVVTRQQTLIQVITHYLNDVGAAYLKYAARSLTAHKVKVTAAA